MDESHALPVLLALDALSRPGVRSQRWAQETYWQYVSSRGWALGVPMRSPEEFAFVRLMCMQRVVSAAELAPVREAWEQLDARQRRTCSDFLLADGIAQATPQFSFLPLYFSNARANASVGPYRALAALVEVVEMVGVDRSSRIWRSR